MADTYTLHVAGLTRELTICKVNDHMDIAAFIMLGDAELTVAAAAELLKKCPEFDILLTAEAKGIPLAHEMSRQSGKPYVCARKGVKLYMPDPVVVEDQSITTAGKQKLVIDRKELDKMNGKRVLVVGLKCYPMWRTPKGIELVGPRYFGIDADYIPVEERVKGGAANV